MFAGLKEKQKSSGFAVGESGDVGKLSPLHLLRKRREPNLALNHLPKAPAKVKSQGYNSDVLVFGPGLRLPALPAVATARHRSASCAEHTFIGKHLATLHSLSLSLKDKLLNICPWLVSTNVS